EPNRAPGLYPRHWEALLGAQTVRSLSLVEGVQWSHLLQPSHPRDVRFSAQDEATARQGEGANTFPPRSSPNFERGETETRVGLSTLNSLTKEKREVASKGRAMIR